MAGKQLGKWRQWAGEVISSKDKTAVSEDFKDLEKDIELRRQGLWKLHVASDVYKHALSKKKACEALPDDGDLLPVESLGIVMIQHGEEFGKESIYGSSLVSLGRAHCKIAALQENLAMSFEETFLASIVHTEDEVKEYQHQRKKLESRRLSHDAAHSKLEKLKSANGNAKKEKERQEAEEEYEHAKSRYEEMERDVRARMLAIRENEVSQLKDLTTLLEQEVTYAHKQLEALQEVQSDWIDDASLSRMMAERKHIFKSIPSKHSTSSMRQPQEDPVSGSDEEKVAPSSRRKSFLRRKSDATSKPPSRAPSRPQSRNARSRANSTATAASAGDKDDEGEKDKASKEKEKEKGKDKGEKPKRLSMGGWMGSMSSRSKNKKDKDKFSALMDDRDDEIYSDDSRGSDDENVDVDGDGRYKRPSSALSSSSKNDKKNNPTPKKSKSSPSTPTASPKITSKLLWRSSASANSSPLQPAVTPSSQTRLKVVVALHDFTASTSDELSFKSGDQIVVTNEVLDDWWMGELRSDPRKKGLFPTTYTRVLPSPDGHKSSSSLSVLASKASLSRRMPEREPDSGSEDDLDHISPMVTAAEHPVIPARSHIGFGPSSPVASDTDDHPFSDSNVASSRSPLGAYTFQNGRNGLNNFDADSITSHEADDYGDEHDSLVPVAPEPDTGGWTSVSSRTAPASNFLAPPLPARKLSDVKKTPPPPPPPRRGSSANILNTLSTPQPPPIPRRPSTLSHSSQSSGASSFVTIANTTTPSRVDMLGSDGLTYSPFDAPGELSSTSGCRNFKQNPFKPKGMCSNCFQTHS